MVGKTALFEPEFLHLIDISYWFAALGGDSESDYAAITREFEDHADEKVLEAVKNATAAALAASSVTTALNAEPTVSNVQPKTCESSQAILPKDAATGTEATIPTVSTAPATCEPNLQI